MSTQILIVDDDAQIRASLRKALRTEGYEVIVAADGPEGIEKFRASKIDLLLLDLNLPVKSGWDTFEQFTSINPLVPIVIITGRRDQRDLASAAGVGALFEKPLDVQELLATIQQLIAEPPELQLQRLAELRSHLRLVQSKATPVRALETGRVIVVGKTNPPYWGSSDHGTAWQLGFLGIAVRCALRHVRGQDRVRE